MRVHPLPSVMVALDGIKTPEDVGALPPGPLHATAVTCDVDTAPVPLTIPPLMDLHYTMDVRWGWPLEVLGLDRGRLLPGWKVWLTTGCFKGRHNGVPSLPDEPVVALP